MCAHVYRNVTLMAYDSCLTVSQFRNTLLLLNQYQYCTKQCLLDLRFGRQRLRRRGSWPPQEIHYLIFLIMLYSAEGEGRERSLNYTNIEENVIHVPFPPFISQYSATRMVMLIKLLLSTTSSSKVVSSHNSVSLIVNIKGLGSPQIHDHFLKSWFLILLR